VSSEDLQKAKNICLRLIKIRPRSEYELRSRLIRNKFDSEIITQAIAGLSKIGLVDDLAFARLWVESRIKKPLGLNRLSFELKIKGINKEIIDKVISEYDSPTKEEEIVRELVKQKIKKLADLSKEKIKNRLWGFLLRRGFSKDIVYDVLSEL
jgi:regulatory protein